MIIVNCAYHYSVCYTCKMFHQLVSLGKTVMPLFCSLYHVNTYINEWMDGRVLCLCSYSIRQDTFFHFPEKTCRIILKRRVQCKKCMIINSNSIMRSSLFLQVWLLWDRRLERSETDDIPHYNSLVVHHKYQISYVCTDRVLYSWIRSSTHFSKASGAHSYIFIIFFSDVLSALACLWA